MSKRKPSTPQQDVEKIDAVTSDNPATATKESSFEPRPNVANDNVLDTTRLLEVLIAFRKGDLSQRMPVNLTGVDGKICDALNEVVDQCQNQLKEVNRVAEVVGREGRFTQRAATGNLTGSWADSINSVNTLIDDLVQPTTEVARVISAVAKGDLSQKMALHIEGRPVVGEFLQAANNLNAMVDQLNLFAGEVTRVAQEVGTEGKLGGQAQVKGVSGTWQDLTNSVNTLAQNLTDQVRDIAVVTTAVANGDLSQKISVEVRGEVNELKETINTMVDQLRAFSDEVTRVAREVGTEGKLGGQATVEGVAGTWQELTENVNAMASNLTAQVRDIAQVTTAVANGDLSKKITVKVSGEVDDLKNTINTMVDQLTSFSGEVTRVAREVGTEGKLGGQATVEGVAGVWQELTENVNTMCSNLTQQVRNVAEVTTAVANGDLTRKVEIKAKGEVLALTKTINTMVDQLNAFSGEVTRVALEVGTEGKLGGQAKVQGVAGTWQDLTENVNAMASNLTAQVRDIAEVTTAVANGDLSKKITVEVRGEVDDLKNTINTMVDQLGAFSGEVTRVAREVGTEGQLGGQATVEGVAGTWQELTENVNQMASNLTAQVRDIAEVTTAVANGDLSKKITVEVRGEVDDLKNTINTMVDQLGAFSGEVTRVAREVGSEGKLGGQATVEGVAGTWQELTENVNQMAGNLTAQVRDIAQVTTAVAMGDLSKKITVEVRGEVDDLKNTINTMVDQLSSFSGEVTRVAREVGTEGKLGGQATVQGAAGVWQELTVNVNTMCSNLTDQVRNVAEVTTAVANGDLTRKVEIEAKGEVLALTKTINTMVDQLSAFTGEVTRVAREVGSDGMLGGQAQVADVKGTWLELTNNVNTMASNLTAQVRDIAQVTTAVANGDLSRKITVNVRGEVNELKETINRMVDQLSSFSSEVTRMAREVGTEGKLGGQAQVEGVRGTWLDLTDNVNIMGQNLTDQVRDIALVATAVANGDLSRKITVEVRGEVNELKNTINTMVDQLSNFSDEVTRVARDVGTEGKLGVQAEVRGLAGSWRDLTDNVNAMCSNLTDQVRGVSKVVTAVANGDLSGELQIEARGEVAELADVINGMVRTLGAFAEQVTRVARDVGIEGQLGGQADVPGAEGTWRELTDNVNLLANNLTTQVRSIAEVVPRVIDGDLTQQIEVEARGEVGSLATNMNQMIRTLGQTMQTNTDENWLKTNLATCMQLTTGASDLKVVTDKLLQELAPMISMQHGVVYLAESPDGQPTQLKLSATYAFKERKHLSNVFQLGEGLVGECAAEKKRILLTDVPADYVQISSGLGEARPLNLSLLPVLFENELMAVIELASFHRFTPIQMDFLDQLSEALGVGFNAILATQRNEELLGQSQSMTEELQSQQEELQQTNEELEVKAQMVEQKNKDVQEKNTQVELARADLEEKARDLEVASQYKSEFLANMSHELRTPLNSLLILSKNLASNRDGNLNEDQMESADMIHGGGRDLLNLINEILDLSKIEAGKMDIHVEDIQIASLADRIRSQFAPLAGEKQLQFDVEVATGLGTIRTDIQRAEQILKNLLSNAFKFTSEGSVRLSVAQAANMHQYTRAAHGMIAFTVTDSGIGIPSDKQRAIFEAFQQGDGSTCRNYGGTGLGLAISRELARLLGGQILVESEEGKGSAFTLLLPQTEEERQTSNEAGVPVVEPSNPHSTRTPRTPSAGGSLRTTPATPAIPANQSSGSAVNLGSPAFNTPSVPSSFLPDDRDALTSDSKSLLVIEDDRNFAKVLMQMARDGGYKCLAAGDGRSGFQLATRYLPTAILLDLGLPDIDGIQVLDQLKIDLTTRHIPVHIVSARDKDLEVLRHGAVGYITKPADPSEIEEALAKIEDLVESAVKEILIVEDDKASQKAITEIVESLKVKVKVTVADRGQKAVDLIKAGKFDCVVLDLNLVDSTGFEVLEALQDVREDLPPIIVYTGRELTSEENHELSKYADSIIVKGANSPERLLDGTALFLHSVEATLPEQQQRMMKMLHSPERDLEGKRVLLVDDDVRNTFALSKVLQQHGLTVVMADNGARAIEKLESDDDIDIVLMDIMMPVMDGYEATRKIRMTPRYETLPIIALTAKAMPEDHEKCLQAGASDYLVKPVDVDQLLSLMRVWLFEEVAADVTK